jgi:glycine betaine/choline ABC-type transport system substrate-binding protein
MQELNRQVNEDAEDPADVARQYLIDQGLIQG